MEPSSKCRDFHSRNDPILLRSGAPQRAQFAGDEIGEFDRSTIPIMALTWRSHTATSAAPTAGLADVLRGTLYGQFHRRPQGQIPSENCQRETGMAQAQRVASPAPRQRRDQALTLRRKACGGMP
jgi:hypothetical protein